MMPTAAKKPVSTPSVEPFRQFGLEWNGPSRAWSEIQKRRFCARHGRGAVPVYEHRKAIMEALWPDDTYEMHFWSDQRLKSVCDNAFTIWMAPGSSSKTTDAAAMALEYWLEAPHETAVIVCSTTKDMLRRRIWSQIVRLWNGLPKSIEFKGVLTDTSCMIRWEDGDLRNGIFGIAVGDGPTEEAINNLIGIHTTRVWVILDEMQGVREAIMGAIPNLLKNPESRFLGMGNPDSLMSMLCKYAEPIGGWDSVERAVTESWEIQTNGYDGTARAYFFDGRKSPACVDPVWGKKNPWMINQKQIDNHRNARGENDPSFWAQAIGWPPPMGVDNTVLDAQLVEKFRCKDPAIWTDGFEAGWALDPAFTDGGDRKILQLFKLGVITDYNGQRWVIEYGEWFDVPIDVLSEDPVEDQIAMFVKEKCQSKGLKSTEGGLDSGGRGGALIGAFKRIWGPVIAVEFGGAPSDLPVDEKGTKAKDVFDRHSSELNIMVRNFAAAHGIRGMSREAVAQFTARKTTYRNGKYIVQKKSEMKQALGFSPDNSDACCIGADIARQRGAVPGAPISVQTREEQERAANEMDMVFEEEQILVSEFV